MEISCNSEEMGNDVPLETKMESLEINEEASCSSTSSVTPKRRSLRKRVPTLKTSESKRRVIIKPKKRLNTGGSNVDDVSQIYLCKKFKRLTPPLETIFEEPKISKANEVLYTELRKKKRFLIFDQNEKKIKKRQQKVKKFFGKTVFKKKRSSMDLLLQKLCDVE